MISVIDYQAGNLTSVERALRHLFLPCRVTDDPEVALRSDRLIIPGVGAAGQAMKVLGQRGLDQAVKAFFRSGKPMLGICLGTQIIMKFSQENQTPCLGILDGEVRRFPDPHLDPEGRVLKIPHMGWNRVQWTRSHPVLSGVSGEAYFYFVHSYYPLPAEEQCVLGRTVYGFPFPSALAFQNLVAFQFHPEKSGPAGLALLQAFSQWGG